MKKLLVFIFLFFFIFLIINTMLLFGGKIKGITGNVIKNNEVNYNNPEEVIDNLYNAIEISKEKGEYKCCIEPACTMCYLGHWKFEKGTCYCDDAIMEGKMDDVCPECVKGIEKGFCKSSVKSEQGDCILEENIFGGIKNEEGI